MSVTSIMHRIILCIINLYVIIGIISIIYVCSDRSKGGLLFMEARFVISLVFAILVAIFAIQNSSIIVINFLFTQFSISQALVILISAVIGAIIVMILAAITRIKLSMKLNLSIKAITKLEEENKLLAERIEKFSAISDAPKENEPKVIVSDIER
jgi:uncharacterized integral membrane protein